MDPTVLLLLVTVGLLVMLTMSRRRQQREQQSMQSRLAPGSEVMTGSGLFATVVSVEDNVVVLETAPGQRSRWDRRAVARVLSTPPADTTDDEAPDDERPLDDEAPDDRTLDAAQDPTLHEPWTATSAADETAPGGTMPDDLPGTGDGGGASKES